MLLQSTSKHGMGGPSLQSSDMQQQPSAVVKAARLWKCPIGRLLSSQIATVQTYLGVDQMRDLLTMLVQHSVYHVFANNCLGLLGDEH